MTPKTMTRVRPLTRRIRNAIGATLSAMLMALALGATASAQGMFSPLLYVNDSPITVYEVDQREKFLDFIGAGGADPRERALERLIEERLQLQEVERLGARLTPDQLDAGMAEFAARAQLTTEEFMSRLTQAGIDTDTFVQFIRAGVMWRELIRALYGSQVRITESQVDTALSPAGLQPQIEVLISEIFLPNRPELAADIQRIVPLIRQIRSESDFANAARQVSAAPTGPAGGRVDRWINIAAMPPEVGSVFAEAAPGTIVGPLDSPGAIAFFMLRARRETRGVSSDQIELDYARALLPGGNSAPNRERVAQIEAGVDSCADFPAVALRTAPELPDSAVERLQQPQPSVPRPVLAELERLNPGEVSANLTEGDALVVLMLCARRITGEGVPGSDEVEMSLLSRALEGQSLLYLERLRAEAEIRTR